MYLKRQLSLRKDRSYLILGARQVGKSTYLKNEYPDAEYIDLLKTDVYFEYQSRPALLRERFAKSDHELIIIDEVQKIPELMNEVHWCIENTNKRFIVSGSTARKLRKQGVTNLAGRLKMAKLLPLTYHEIQDYDLNTRLQHGSLPPMVTSDDPADDLKDYCGEYLREEVYAESLVRNIPGFTKFLEMAAIGNAQVISYSSIARDCGVASKTIKEYYQILEDTLLAYLLEPWTKSIKRRATTASKFYYFDCGIPNSLLHRNISPKTPEYGLSFEHGMILEAYAQKAYGKNIHDLKYWRSSNGFEVDLLINESIGVEFKSGAIHGKDSKGLMALKDDLHLKECWIVGTESQPRHLENGVEVIPWMDYIQRLRELD
jgi:predicted AAA+ superfamily ATPase